MSLSIRAGVLVCALFGGVLPRAAVAQVYPSRPITMVVPSAPGGLSDPVVRFLGDALQRAWGQPVVMEHRSGAGGVVGTQSVAHAAPDGHTLLFGNIGPLAVTPALQPKLPYSVQRDFEPVALVLTFKNVLVVNPALPVNSVAELIQLARDKPGTLNFASAGNGQSHHLSGELFKSMTGVDIVHVPYKGSGPALTDLIGGQVQMMFSNIPAALPHIRSGKLPALAVTGLERSSETPAVPTINEAGVPGYNVVSWVAIVAPAKTPKAIVERLNSEVQKAWSTAEGQKLLAQMNADAGGGTPEFLASFMNAESAKWTRLIQDAKIKAE